MSEELNACGAHAPDLSDCSEVVKERFAESAERAEMAEIPIYYIDGMEGALIGTMENEYGNVVAVYEREMCIRCIKESFGPDWMNEPAYGYSDEEKADADFLDMELTTMAIEYFEYNTLRSLPYLKEFAPVIMNGFSVDIDRLDEMRTA